MKNVLKILAVIAFLNLGGSIGRAEIIYAASFADGLAKAKTYETTLIVLAHGDWNGWNSRLYKDMFESKSMNSQLSDRRVVFADVKVLQNPTDDDKKSNQERNNGWNGKGVRSYPAVVAYAGDGTRLGVRQDTELPSELTAVRKTVLELAKACERLRELQKTAESAKSGGDKESEIKAIVAMAELPLDRPAGLLERIKELDPADASGHYARLSFPHWFRLFSDVTSRTKNGEGAKVEAELKGMLQVSAYTTEQRAQIYNALGNCYRHQQGQDEQAAQAFKQAWQTAPGTFAGEIGRRCYEGWYKDLKTAGSR